MANFRCFIALIFALSAVSPAWSQQGKSTAFPKGAKKGARLQEGGRKTSVEGGRQYVPGVYSDRHEEATENFEGDPNDASCLAMTKHVGDLVADDEFPDNKLPGVKAFMDKLQNEIQGEFKNPARTRPRADHPRWRVIKNAERARDDLVDGYDMLRWALSHLGTAKEIIEEFNDEFQPIVDKIRDGTDQMDPPIQQMEQAAQSIETEPPDASGGPVDPGPFDQYEPQEDKLKDKKDKLDDAENELDQAESWLDNAKQIAYKVDTKAKKAGELDEAFNSKASESRTRRIRRGPDSGLTSKRVLDNAKQWLETAADACKDSLEKGREVVKANDGVARKAHKKAEDADKDAKKAKETGLESADKVNGAVEQVRGENKSQYEEGEQLKQEGEQASPPDDNKISRGEQQMREAVDGAQSAKDEADQAQQKAKEDVDKAKDKAKQAKEKAEEVEDKFEEYKKLVGEDTELPDIPPYFVWVQPPLDPKRTRPIGKDVPSKGLKYPDALNKSTGEIADHEFQEGSYTSKD